VIDFHKQEREDESVFSDVGTAHVEKRMFVCPHRVEKGTWPETWNVCEVWRQTLSAGGRSVDVVSIRVKYRLLDGKQVRPPAGASFFEDYYNPKKLAKPKPSQKKSQICLHFTAGGTGPAWLMRGNLGYPGDNYPVGVPFAITAGGTIYELFEDQYWGYSSSSLINEEIIAIEMGNYGPVRLYSGRGGKYWGSVGKHRTKLCTQGEGDEWVWELPKPYRGEQHYLKFPPAQYDALNRLLGYLTAKYPEIPFTLLPDDDPDPEKSTRFKCLNPYYSRARSKGARDGYQAGAVDIYGFRGIVSHVNWAGKENGDWIKWDIGPAFEWERLGAPPTLYAPLQKPTSGLPTPASLYFKNEVEEGGNFVVGTYANVHGGIHLAPATPGPAAVRAMAPGTIVAARLHPGGSTSKTAEFTGNYNGFVLLRHVVKDVAGNQEFPLYSLYMHLSYPSWPDKAADDPYHDVPWARRFFMRQHGALVDARLGPTFGNIRWVATKGVAPDAVKCDVFKSEDLSTEPFTIKGKVRADGTQEVLGVFKPAPAEITNAVQALRDGKVVSFHEPYLIVDSGDIIGHVTPLPGGSGGFLHWEVFSAASSSGIQKLLNLDPDIGQQILNKHLVRDSSNDNHLDRQDFINLVKTAMHADEKRVFQEVLDEADREGWRDRLFTDGKFAAIYNRHRSSPNIPFAKNVPTDTPIPQGMLAFGLDLVIRRSTDKVQSGTYHVTLGFVDEHGAQLPKDHPFTIELAVPVSNSEFTKRIPVPAATARIVVTSKELDLAKDAPVLTTTQQKKEDTALLENLVDFRLRNVLLKHVTEWSESGLQSLYDKSADLKSKFKFEDITPTVWWGTNDRKFGEVPVLGSGSVFGTAELPQSGEIHNLHPVTALGLLWRLQREGKIDFATPAATFVTRRQPNLIHLGFATDAVVNVGDTVGLLAIREDYNTGDKLRLYVEAGSRLLELGQVEYANGVAKALVPAAFWGNWTLKAQNLTPSPSNATPASSGCRGDPVLRLAIPKLDSVSKAEVVSGSRQHKLRLTFSENCPAEVHALVILKCARIAKGTTSGASGPAAPPSFVLSKWAVAVSGKRSKGKASTTGGEVDLVFETGALLRDLAGEVGAQDGDHVQVAMGVYVPNGGQAAIDSPADFKIVDSKLVELLSPTKTHLAQSTNWNDDRGVGKPPDITNPILNFENVAFGEITTYMTANGMVVTVSAGLAPAIWKGMTVQMKCNDKPVSVICNAVKKGAATVASFDSYLTAKQLKDLDAIGPISGPAKTAKFGIEIVGGSTLGYTAPQKTWDAKSLVPELGVPDPIDPKMLAESDPRYPLFKTFLSKHKKPDDYYCLIGQAKWMETGLDLVINCFIKSPPPPSGSPPRPDGFVASPDLDALFEYSSGTGKIGRCDANGYFGAWIQRKFLQSQSIGTEIKFVWGRPSRLNKIIWENEVKPQECRQVYVVRAGSP
jgi:hypothetical protein